MGVNPKIEFFLTPNHLFAHRVLVVHYFHHPFWWVFPPIFGNTQMDLRSKSEIFWFRNIVIMLKVVGTQLFHARCWLIWILCAGITSSLMSLISRHPLAKYVFVSCNLSFVGIDWGCSPFPGCQSPPGFIHVSILVGDPINLHGGHYYPEGGQPQVKTLTALWGVDLHKQKETWGTNPGCWLITIRISWP